MKSGIRAVGRAAGKSAWRTAAFFALFAVGVPIGVVAASVSRADREIEDRLRAHIQMLASDDFDGREPGTDGEAKTLRYLAKQWFDIGLVSGTNDPGNEWFAPVTVVAHEPSSGSARFLRKGFRATIAPSDVLVFTSGKRSLVRNAPLLFVGRARSQDFTRNELAGRIAVVLDGNTPDSARQNELLALGASAVLTVLDGERTLDEVAARRRRSGYALSDEALGGDLEAFIGRATMETLLKGTAHTFDDLEQAASKDDFAPIVLDVTASLEAATDETTIRTHNLIGKLPGRSKQAGAVLFVAHWDHFGECGEPPAEDVICNGAVDNASGVAALTEVARRLSRSPQMDRDVYFLATTAEELGLLGAHAFAESPPLPLERIVAAFNIDSIAIAPRKTPFAIVGRGMTGLDKDIAKVAKAEGFKLRENNDANEYVKRQDGWALLQHDIPAVMVTTSYGDIERMRAFFDGDYHRPSDDLSHPIELGGASDDVKMLTALGRWFADTRKVPVTPMVAKAPVSAK
ncbi:M28 family peptidase [Novosphingobium sp. fls2-241-R2A-195]|uniref:M28 family peptidase n=1 Tax=Novosphingobium sp. fls2-241-R2A-195 TaxID=3040296 RepID=UPI002551938C|nr:M28 family peptidase [Novosphingobium sp. fls2-241-R2A-195]